MEESCKKDLKKRSSSFQNKIKGFIGNKEKEKTEAKHKEATNAYLR